jgi:Fe-S cluster biogenesis protein NfuA
MSSPAIPAAPPDEPKITVHEPVPDSDTCKIELDREISPDGTLFFETYAEAKGWPLVQSLMRVPGVHSVIAKGHFLILAKHAGAEWESILEPAQAAIRVALSPDSERSPVDAIAAAAKGSGPEEDIRERVQVILDAEINPSVAAHGGYITLLDVQGTRVFVQLGGGCQGCAMSTATLKQGVEVSLKSQIPEITEVLDTTDHAAGSNPFFQSPQF